MGSQKAQIASGVYFLCSRSSVTIVTTMASQPASSRNYGGLCSSPFCIDLLDSPPSNYSNQRVHVDVSFPISSHFVISLELLIHHADWYRVTIVARSNDKSKPRKCLCARASEVAHIHIRIPMLRMPASSAPGHHPVRSCSRVWLPGREDIN